MTDNICMRPSEIRTAINEFGRETVPSDCFRWRIDMKLRTLPKLGEQLDGGIFAGIITNTDGTNYAVVLLPGKGYDLNWREAKSWAAEQGGELPSRLVASLLFSNLKGQLRPEWHWTADEVRASYAWLCSFGNGTQYDSLNSCKVSAVAVRLLSLED